MQESTTLYLRNGRVLFIMVNIHPVRNSQFMKSIRGVYSYFQEENFKISNNQQLLPHTAIMERVCASLKVNRLAYEYRKCVEVIF
jgi:hypothetical protein